MTDEEVVLAFVNRGVGAGSPSLGVEGDALMVDGWWPAALWLGPATCLVRLDDGPRPSMAGALAPAFAAAGMGVLGHDLDAPIEAVTAHRLGVIGGQWQVWATSETAGLADIATAAG